MRDLIQQLKEAKGRATIKKLSKADKSYGDRAAEFRTGAKWGLYWDGKLVAEIVSSAAGYMDPVNWTVQTPDDWQPLKTFYKQDGGVKSAKAWALDNAEAIAALGPKPGPKAQAKLFTLRGYEKVGTVWKKKGGLKEAILPALVMRQYDDKPEFWMDEDNRWEVQETRKKKGVVWAVTDLKAKSLTAKKWEFDSREGAFGFIGKKAKRRIVTKKA